MAGGGAVLGLAVWLAIEHQTRVGLEREQQTLQQRLPEMALLIASNQQLSNLLVQGKSSQPLTEDQSRELLRLRGEAGLLRQQIRELQAVRDQNPKAHEALESDLKNQSAGAASAATADYWPQDSWAFKGYATPDAALQSSLWAANNGDVKALLASATGEMQKVMEEDLKNKPETEASVRAMDEVMGIKSLRVLNRELRDDGTVVITAEFEGRTGNRTEKLMMKKIGDEWKLSGPAIQPVIENAAKP
jgi:hypothetical protein